MTIGNAAFVGVCRKRVVGFGDDYDARGSGKTFEEALASATVADAERKEQVARFVEKVAARNAVTIDGDTITKTWRGTEHVVRRLDGGAFEYLGVRYKSATAVAKAITGARAISGPLFLGLDAQKARVA
jgi:hypothetical protein